MAFGRNPKIAADGTFSSAGTDAWNNQIFGVTDAVSGGIPFFDSTTTEGTSALLAANAVVLGGGAGAAPFTSGDLTFNDTTDVLTVAKEIDLQTGGAAANGVGARFGVTTNSYTIWQRFNTVLHMGVDYAAKQAFDATGIFILSGAAYRFSSSTTDPYATQTNLSQQAAGVLQVGTSTIGSTGSIRCKYQSSDGTAGVASFGPAGVASITVKDGIITAIS